MEVQLECGQMAKLQMDISSCAPLSATVDSDLLHQCRFFPLTYWKMGINPAEWNGPALYRYRRRDISPSWKCRQIFLRWEIGNAGKFLEQELLHFIYLLSSAGPANITDYCLTTLVWSREPVVCKIQPPLVPKRSRLSAAHWTVLKRSKGPLQYKGNLC